MALTIEGSLTAEETAAASESERPAPEASSTLALRDELGDAYVERLVRALGAARLNRLFPPERALRTHLRFLGPQGSRGLYKAVQISLLNGMPTTREILRVKIDRDLAASFLSDVATRPAPPAVSPLARRIAYYTELAGCETMPTHRMSVELRQQLPEENRALFRVIFDRFDLAGNQFVRYTMLLGQRDRFWRRRHVLVDDADLAAPTEGFRRTVSRFAAHDSELAFVLLSQQEAIEVEDVQRCRVGPLLLPGMKVGAELEALLDPEAGPCAGDASTDRAPALKAPPWILCFPTDRAGLEVAEHSGRDPLAPLLREAVSAQARELVDAKADELGYRVAKSRKFVCPPVLQAPLEELCRRLGTPSIVKAV
jgi:hypothetical protein